MKQQLSLAQQKLSQAKQQLNLEKERFKNEIERFKNEIERFKNESEIARLETLTCKADIENIKYECESFIGDIDYQILINDTSYFQHESERLTSYLEPNKTIIISLIRIIDDAREIDTCSGMATRFGYLTSYTCCQADELILHDLNNSEDILIDEDSLWVEDSICLINKTEVIDFNFSMNDYEIYRQCSLSMYDNHQERFNDHKFDLKILGCFDSPCELAIDSNLYQNQTILNGTLIICENSIHSAIIIKSKYKLIQSITLDFQFI